MHGREKQTKHRERETKEIREGEETQPRSSALPKRARFPDLMTVNRILLALGVALLLVLLLVVFTDMADAVIGSTAFVAGLVLFLFPGLTNIPNEPWFKLRGTTFALVSLMVFVGGLDSYLIYSSGKTIKAHPGEVQAIPPTASALTVVPTVPTLPPALAATIEPSPSPSNTLQPTASPTAVPSPTATPPSENTKILILLANFDGPDQQKYRVTDAVYQNLVLALKQYPDVQIDRLTRSFTTSPEARAEGDKAKAAMVIWGWYGLTANVAPVSVHLEVLCPLMCAPELGPEAEGQVRLRDVQDLNSFALQTSLSAELSYLSHFIVGMVRYTAYQWDEAIASFSAALDQTKEPIPALDRTKIYHRRSDAYSNIGKYDLAIADLNTVIEIAPTSSWAYNNRGVNYNSKKMYDAAIVDLTRAIELDPSDTSYRKSRGIVYDNNKEYDNAIVDYSQVLSTTNDAQVYNLRGGLYHLKGEYDSAIRDFTEAIKLNDSNYKFYENRAATYYVTGNDDDAIDDFTRALKLKGGDAELYNGRGAAYAHKGAFEQAISDFGQAIAIQGNNAVIYQNRGFLYLQKHLYDQAIYDLTKAIRLKPDVAEYYSLRGSAYFSKQEYNKAINDASQAIRLEPNDPNHYHNRGRAYSAIGNYDKAIADYTQAIGLQSNEGKFFLDRGMAYMLKGENDKAIPEFRQVLILSQDPAIRSSAEAMLKISGSK